MSSIAYSTRLDGDRPSRRRRAGALALALAIELLLILGFFTLNFRNVPDRFKGGALSTFDVAPLSSEQDRSASLQRRAEPRTVPKQPIPTTAPPIPRATPTPSLDMLELTREEFAAADIARLGTAGGKAAPASTRMAGDSALVGNAPNGEPLYAAEWVRRPTNAELAGYMPKSMPDGGGAGLVACRTAPRNRVGDCVELGSTPPGSRLASAVRQAAWQFLVRPPRVGGKPMIGTWVRIRIDYVVGTAGRS